MTCSDLVKKCWWQFIEKGLYLFGGKDIFSASHLFPDPQVNCCVHADVALFAPKISSNRPVAQPDTKYK